MTLAVLAYLAGVLTILSPCILPVLPFVFARADRPFLSSTAPVLLGMAATFAGVATLAAVGGAWAAHANQAGRYAAIALFILFGLSLLFENVAERLAAPFVALGNRLNARAGAQGAGVGAAVLLGAATGLLWAPCAGPILGLLLTTAAVQGASAKTALLLFAYALGAATSLAVALFAGGRVFAALKKSLGAGAWIRRGLGAAVLAGALAIAFGLDTGVLARLSLGGTTTLEQALLGKRAPGAAAPSAAAAKPAPAIDGGVAWLNSPPLTLAELRGKVVLIDFWTYSCINCLRALPYVKAWAEKYRDGLVVIGVHAPEFAFERDPGNVRRAVQSLGVTYPVVLDNDYAIWRAYQNNYWPAHYFIDAQGRLRHQHFGEGAYAQSEDVIRMLLAEAGYRAPAGAVAPQGEGASAPAAAQRTQSRETYIGYARRANFASAQQRTDVVATFAAPDQLQLNQWALSGVWSVGAEKALLEKAGGSIRFKFLARDLHLVLAPGADGKPVRFRVSLDGAPPGAAHGGDVDAAGAGVIREQRLYQLIRGQPAGARVFEIEFLDPGAQAFAFTFGHLSASRLQRVQHGRA
ncbi:MAG: cytochrome c biogenesis protein DipZ [Hyphomonadaceae bacterium]